MNTLTIRFGPNDTVTGAAIDCDHGSILLGERELATTWDAGQLLGDLHRARHDVDCPMGQIVRHWPDARDALAQYERAVLNFPPETKPIDIDMTVRILADLRERVPCPTCAVALTLTIDPERDRTVVSSQWTHYPTCADYVERERTGGIRSTYEPIRPSPAA